MRRSSTKLWPELRKEVSRFTNLVWVAALVLWLGLTSSGYSPWHSHDLHTKWLSLTRANHGHFEGLHGRRQQQQQSSLHMPVSSTDTSSLLASPHHWDKIYKDNDLPMEAGLSSPIKNGLNVSTARADDAHHVHHLDINERKEEEQQEEEDEPHQFMRSKEQNTHEGTNYQATNEVPNNGTRKVGPRKTCASVEEMGFAAGGNVATSSMRVRRIIDNYFAEHGAHHVRELPAQEFCHRGFVYGRAAEYGLGNDIYKILTASGLSIMLNRSLIIAEHGSTNPAYFGLTGHVRLPFGDYLKYSNQTFSISEVKRLWVKHDCAGAFQRPLIMRIDDFQRPTRTKVFCEDWTKWKHPIIWFKGTTDSNALQFFLKNRHPVMRSSASLLFGDPTKPSSRPNAFGEIFQAFISPMPVIEEAVQWALQGIPDPDIAVHMRMLNSRSRAASYAVCSCIRKVVKKVLQNKTLPQVVIVSDTPFIIEHVKEQLEGFAQVVHFDYESFMRSHHNLSKVMMGNYSQPPENRVRDWGSMPRWVAIVDLFLASRAKSAVISGANRRVGTTYAQLLASLAAAMRTDEQGGNPFGFGFYSSFQSSLLAKGLAGQRGWGHTWRRFGGHLSCNNQTIQCAQTPLLPYAWWDGPWQSPAPRDVRRMSAYGIKVLGSGGVKEDGLAKTCERRKTPMKTLQLLLPSCKRLKLCRQ